MLCRENRSSDFLPMKSSFDSFAIKFNEPSVNLELTTRVAIATDRDLARTSSIFSLQTSTNCCAKTRS